MTQQVCHEDESIFQYADKHQALALVIGGDLAAQFGHPFFNLFGGDNYLQVRRQAFFSAHVCLVSIASIRTACCPGAASYPVATGKSRTQTIVSPLRTTGQEARLAAGIWRS